MYYKEDLVYASVLDHVNHSGSVSAAIYGYLAIDDETSRSEEMMSFDSNVVTLWSTRIARLC